MEKVKFASLWIGENLPKLQYTCLSSFVYYGHEIDLYVYDMSMNVPDGVNKKDASEILPESEIFLVENTYAAFSDLFRYNMINKTGRAWVDADTICLSSDWNFKDNIFACVESGGLGSYVVGGVLSLPKSSEIVNFLIEEASRFNKSKIVWNEIGPELVDKAFKKFDYMEYVHPQEVFCGISVGDFNSLWDPNSFKRVLLLEKTSKSISAYNQMITRSGRDKDMFPEGSAIKHFYNKFVLKN